MKKNTEIDIREVSWFAGKIMNPFQDAGDEVGEKKKRETNRFKSYRSQRWPKPTASWDCRLDFPFSQNP